MPLVIVPNSLYAAIMAKLDAAIAAEPAAEKDRDLLYRQLLAYFHEHGTIPDFTLKKPEACRPIYSGEDTTPCDV